MAIEPVYTISSKASGGGRDGEVVSATGRIDLSLRPPKEMGGSGDGSNPEELFSAGYAACFLGASAPRRRRPVARCPTSPPSNSRGHTAATGPPRSFSLPAGRLYHRGIETGSGAAQI